MMLTRRLRLQFLLPAACCLLVAGCAKTQSGVAPQAEKSEVDPKVNSDLHDRVRDLQVKLALLEVTVANLPGSGSTREESEKNHRDLMKDGFAKLAEIFPLVEGTQPSGEFQQTLRIITSSRTQLANGSMDLAAEPTIDTGLRAVYREMTVVNRDAFGNDAEIAKGLDTVRQRIDELDTVRGPIHRVVVGQVMTATVGVLQRMSQTLAENAPAPMRPASQPATKPATGGTPPTP